MNKMFRFASSIITVGAIACATPAPERTISQNQPELASKSRQLDVWEALEILEISAKTREEFGQRAYIEITGRIFIGDPCKVPPSWAESLLREVGLPSTSCSKPIVEMYQQAKSFSDGLSGIVPRLSDADCVPTRDLALDRTDSKKLEEEAAHIEGQMPELLQNPFWIYEKARIIHGVKEIHAALQGVCSASE